MTSFNLSHLSQNLISQYSHIEGWDFNIEIWWGHNPVHNHRQKGSAAHNHQTVGNDSGSCSSLKISALCRYTPVLSFSFYNMNWVQQISQRAEDKPCCCLLLPSCELTPPSTLSQKTPSAHHLILLTRVLTFKQCDIHCGFKCHPLPSNGDIYFICNSEKENTFQNTAKRRSYQR